MKNRDLSVLAGKSRANHKQFDVIQSVPVATLIANTEFSSARRVLFSPSSLTHTPFHKL